MRILIGFAVLLMTVAVPLGQESAPPAGEATETAETAEPALPEATPGYISVNRYFTGTDPGVPEEDYTASGVFSDFYHWFYVPESWELSPNIYVQLELSHSPVLLRLDSTVTVYLNDVPIQTERLMDMPETRATLRVALPVDKIKRDYNELHLRFYLRAIDEPCRDVDNPSCWATVHRDSILHLEYKIPAGAVDLSQYPYPFALERVEEAGSASFVLPVKPDASEIEAAVSIIAFMTSQSPMGKFDYRIYTMDKAPVEAKTDNLILIGKSGRLPFASDFPGMVKPSGDSGAVGIFASPYSPDKAALLVTARTDAGLSKVTGVLCHREYSRQLSGPTALVEQELYEKTPAEEEFERGIIRLSDLGYGDMATYGTYRSIITFNVSVPEHWRLLEGSFLYVIYSHAGILIPQQSTFTIVLNDVPLKAVELSRENSERAVMRVTIPPNQLDYDSFKTDARFYLDIGIPDCAHEYVERAWGVIHNDSYFKFEYEPARNPLLRHFPGLNIDEKREFDGYIVVPDGVDQGTLDVLAALAEKVGRSLGGRTARLPVVKANDAKGNVRENNLILIGTSKNNKLIKDCGDKLPVAFDNAGNPVPNEKAPFLASYAARCALLEVAASPFESGKYVFIVSGGSSGLSKGAKNIRNKKLYAQLEGNVAFVDGTAEATDFKTFKEKGRKGGPAGISTGPPVFWIIVIIVTGIITVLIIVVLVSRIGARRRKAA
jgi:hypothetical protein